MGDLTLNFSRHEFRCKCNKCDCHTVDFELLTKLQILRDTVRKKIDIISGHRCVPHNSKQPGASPKSQHLFGRAVDIRIDDMRPTQVYELLCKMFPDKYGIGLYSTFVHLDVRPEKHRWIN
jgi:uncharacterized protein YcbK (DUF882 family)